MAEMKDQKLAAAEAEERMKLIASNLRKENVAKDLDSLFHL